MGCCFSDYFFFFTMQKQSVGVSLLESIPKIYQGRVETCGNECHEEYGQHLSFKDQIFMWITHCNCWEGWSQPLSNSAACVGILCTFLGKSWLLSLSQTGCKAAWFSDLLSLFLYSYEVVSWDYMKDILLGDLFIHWQCLRQKGGHDC